MKNLGPITRTPRGFELIEFEDCNGVSCSLQQSSLAEFTPPGSSAVWLGINSEAVGSRMHLNLEQVRSLIKILKRWEASGSFQK